MTIKINKTAVTAILAFTLILTAVALAYDGITHGVEGYERAKKSLPVYKPMAPLPNDPNFPVKTPGNR
jgi:hypothetical protein